MDIIIEMEAGTNPTIITTERGLEVAGGVVIKIGTTSIKITSAKDTIIIIITTMTLTKGPQIQICTNIRNMAKPTLKRQQ